MAPQTDITAPKMTRVTVRVPKTTLDQINEWVDALGVRRSHFLGIALVAGVRSLMRASALDLSISKEISRELEQQTAGSDAVDSDALLQTVNALKSEIADLQAEVVALKEQILQGQGGNTR